MGPKPAASVDQIGFPPGDRNNRTELKHITLSQRLSTLIKLNKAPTSVLIFVLLMLSYTR